MRHAALAVVLTIGCSPAPPPPAAQAGLLQPQRPRVELPFRRCINLGNALEAPSEGDWGYVIRLEDLDRIKQAGFDAVRIPVRWDTHLGRGPDHTIAPDHFERVDAVIMAARARGLTVIIDVHHFDALQAAPRAEAPRFIAIWRQIAARYASHPPGLIYELLNEPNGPEMTAAEVERLNAQALAAIRAVDQARIVIVGPPQWNAISALPGWTPPDDPNIAVTVHYYEPHAFTHAGAEWLREPPRFRRLWGEPADRQRIGQDADRAIAWARERGVALFLGEFGVNQQVPIDQRAFWTREVRKAFEQRGAAWCYWDFGGAFPAYDRTAEAWIPEVRDALLR